MSGQHQGAYPRGRGRRPWVECRLRAQHARFTSSEAWRDARVKSHHAGRHTRRRRTDDRRANVVADTGRRGEKARARGHEAMQEVGAPHSVGQEKLMGGRFEGRDHQADTKHRVPRAENHVPVPAIGTPSQLQSKTATGSRQLRFDAPGDAARVELDPSEAEGWAGVMPRQPNLDKVCGDRKRHVHDALDLQPGRVSTKRLALALGHQLPREQQRAKALLGKVNVDGGEGEPCRDSTKELIPVGEAEDRGWNVACEHSTHGSQAVRLGATPG